MSNWLQCPRVPTICFNWFANYVHSLIKKHLTAVARALVTFRLNYCNVLYIRLPKTIRKLQLVQNAIANWTSKNNGLVSTVLQRLHWFSVSFGTQFKVLFITYIVCGRVPEDLLLWYEPAWPLKSRNKVILQKMPKRNKAGEPGGGGGFCTQLWHTFLRKSHLLPLSLLVFKRWVMTKIDEWAFNLP